MRGWVPRCGHKDPGSGRWGFCCSTSSGGGGGGSGRSMMMMVVVMMETILAVAMTLRVKDRRRASEIQLAGM